MAKLTIRYTTESAEAVPQGWRYLWAKIVTGAHFHAHCARGLKGSYVPAFGIKQSALEPIEVEIPDGGFLYLCGVAKPYRWERNFHLAIQPQAGASAVGNCYNGDRVEVSGGVALPILPDAARERFPERGPKFLTCRNFQFAAQYL